MRLQDALEPALTSADLLERVKCRFETRRRALEEKAEYLRSRFPEHVGKVIRAAERALQGRLILPGTGAEPYFVGDPPDWHANPVGDNEYVCSLNRMRHWKTLLCAYTLAEEPRYARKAVAELRDWIERCLRPDLDPANFRGADPWGSLEAGIRMFDAWPCVVEHLAGTEFLAPDLLERYAVSLFEHGEVLSEISPVYWPDADHNHYLMEMLGLLALSCAMPELKRSKEWQHQAIRELERCAAAQITDGGGQIEGCPSYHNGCTYWFLLSILIARNNELSFSDAYVQRIKKMLSYSTYSFRPSGSGVPWGDSDADKSAVRATLYGYLVLGTTEPLQVVASLAGKKAVLDTALTHISRVPDPDRLIAHLDSSDTTGASLPLVSWQRELKQVMMRTSWRSTALSVFFACRTPINNAHAHIDPMGFDFAALGKPLIVDPGRFTYRDDEDRRRFKSASWHNTLMIDNREPFDYLGTWRYGPQKEGNILNVCDDDDLLAVEAMHRNYEPAIHKRLLALVDQRFMLVADQLTNVGVNARIQLYYHADSVDVSYDAGSNCVFTENGEVNVAVFATDNLACELLKGEVSDSMDVCRDSTRIRFEDTSSHRSTRAYATVIVPFSANVGRPEVDSLAIIGRENDWTCSFVHAGRKYRFVWDNTGFRTAGSGFGDRS